MLTVKQPPAIHLIDFGLAREIKTNSLDYDSPGSPYYIAPERITHSSISFKSDIFSLTPLFAMILGAHNPLEEKMAIRQKHIKNQKKANEEETKIPYNFKGIPDENSYFTRVIISFLNRMQNPDEDERPNITKVIRFFEQAKLFNNLYSNHIKQGLFNNKVSYEMILSEMHPYQSGVTKDAFIKNLRNILK